MSYLQLVMLQYKRLRGNTSVCYLECSVECSAKYKNGMIVLDLSRCRLRTLQTCKRCHTDKEYKVLVKVINLR